jgi:glycosyltransferase involved in cell wall biosynthesis
MDNENKPLVSTITSCYKAERYLPVFLEWLPRQSYFDKLEVVVDHNAPTDREIELIRAFQKEYPGRLKHMISEGVIPYGASWNRCIWGSSADLVTIWNVDDLRTPRSIEIQSKALLDDPDVDVVFGRFRQVRSFPSIEGPVIDYPSIPLSELTKYMFLSPFFMFRKSICSRAGFVDEQFRSSSDYDFVIRLAMHGRIKGISDELGYFLDEGKGLSTRSSSPREVEDIVIRLRYGIFDEVDFVQIPKVISHHYSISNLRVGEKLVPVSDLVPGYSRFMRTQFRKSFLRGMKNQLYRVMRGQYSKIIGQ